MATGQEWQQNIKKLSLDELEKYLCALNDLAMWPMMQKEYFDDVGLDIIRHFIINEIKVKK